MNIKITVPSKTFLLGDYISLLGKPCLVLNTEPRFQCLLAPAKAGLEQDFHSVHDKNHEIASLVQSYHSTPKLSFNSQAVTPSHGGVWWNGTLSGSCRPDPAMRRGDSNKVSGGNSEREVAFCRVQKDFHPNSPAGKFIARYAKDFARHALDFFDPHQGAGGFGASSAQFVMVYALREYLHGQRESSHDAAELLLEIYQELAWSGIGPRPSGADCIGQMQGELCYYHRAAGQLTRMKWPFPDIDFCLLHTGHKINTHQHLQEISMDIVPVEGLKKCAFAAYEALIAANSDDFIQALAGYAEIQKAAGLLAMTTQDLLQVITKYKGVLFAKGCGALGADVICVLLEPRNSLSFVANMQRRGLRVVALGREASEGVKIEEMNEIPSDGAE